MKPVLAVETSDVLCSVCVYFSNIKYYESNICFKNAHSEKLLTLIDNVLNQANISLADLECIIFSEGPGSFTGLRIGLSAVKGLAFGANLPVAMIPTFEASALKISKFLPDGCNFVIISKVNMDELYYAKYKADNNSAYKCIDELSIIDKNELKSKAENTIVFSNLNFEDLSIKNDVWLPEAHFLAEYYLKFSKNNFNYDYDYLEPNYLKKFIVKEKKNV